MNLEIIKGISTKGGVKKYDRVHQRIGRLAQKYPSVHHLYDDANENLVWTVYHCIREIEKSFRTLKSDLDLRPIYHKTDEATGAHIHLGLMAYWVVNTIRHQLKDKKIRSTQN